MVRFAVQILSRDYDIGEPTMTTNETSQLRLGPTNEIVSPEAKKVLRPYLDVAEIRKAYPNPSHPDGTGNPHPRERYCVGGALNRFLHGNEASGFEVMDPLRELGFPDELVCEFYYKITKPNDRGDFEGAWQALKEALEYGIEK